MGIINIFFIQMETHCDNCKNKIEAHHHGHHVKTLGIISEQDVNCFNDDTTSLIYVPGDDYETLDQENEKFKRYSAFRKEPEPGSICGKGEPAFVTRLCNICKKK